MAVLMKDFLDKQLCKYYRRMLRNNPDHIRLFAEMAAKSSPRPVPSPIHDLNSADWNRSLFLKAATLLILVNGPTSAGRENLPG